MAARARAGVARMAAWRAHAYGPLAELRLESARVPPLRAPDDVLVRVHYASINPLDVAMIGGYGARVLNALRALEGGAGGAGGAAGGAGGAGELPLVVGRDFVGEVAAAGAAARAAGAAGRVWGVVPPHRAGAHAQYVLVKDRWVGPAPRALGAGAGGALYAALSACAVVRAAGLEPGARLRPAPRVLLLGLGGVGHAALQLLVHAGAQVVVGCSAELAGRARAAGAASALDRAAADYDDRVVAAGPYEAVIDCAGLGGGAARARWPFRRLATLSSPLLRETDARGLALGAAAAAAALAAQCAALPPPPAPAPPDCAPRVRWAYFAPSPADIDMLRRLADAGHLEVAVERVYPWREGAAAYARAAAGHARGKLLLDWTAGAEGAEDERGDGQSPPPPPPARP